MKNLSKRFLPWAVLAASFTCLLVVLVSSFTQSILDISLKLDGIVVSSNSLSPSNTRTAPNAPSHGERPDSILTRNSIVREKVENKQVISKNGSSSSLITYRPLMIPDDPKADQWWVSNASFNSAWDTARGNHSTLLAVIDTGFALDHEEFNGRWHENTGETGTTLEENPSVLNCSDKGLPISASCNLIDDDYDGVVDNETGSATYQNPSKRNCTDQLKTLTRACNLIDDDANGLADDVRGWDFINHDSSVSAGENNPAGTGTRHGTMVASTAAATGNNSKGIAGADWGTTILPVQALDDDGYGHSVSVARAIRYAVAQNADVISLSLGSTSPDSIVREAVMEAIAAGSVVVAASGNDGCNCMSYPANYPEVVAVGALDTNNAPASFSSWGENLDILAPGVELYTADWKSSNQTSAYASGVSGTSLATPLVSGALTRLLSHQPNAKPIQLVAALTENTNRLGLQTTRNNTLGFGSLNAHTATERMTVARSLSQLDALSQVSTGAYLNPNSPAEVAGTVRSYACQSPYVGTTAIHELIKNSSSFHSISHSESEKAVALGYSKSILAYACIAMPHDLPASIRNIDILREFKNSTEKPLM